MGVDISKAICEAIDIIVNQKLANADFMRTVQGKIVSTQRPNGSYKVTYSGGPGVIQAQPLNDNIIYKQNQAVMLLLGNDNTVVILNKVNTGNNNVVFDSQKYNIVGEQIVYNANNISICNLSSYINDSLMFINSDKSEATTIDETIQRYMKQETTNGVVLSAYFTTRLAASQINGNYGLKFTFQFKKKDSNNLYTKTYTLDVRNITGANPYTLNNAIKVSRIIEDFPYEDFQYIKQIEGFTQNFPHDNNLNEVKDILIADPSISSIYILTEQDKKDFHLFLQAQKGTYLNSTNYTYLPIKAVLKKDGNNIVTNENEDVVTDVIYRWYVKDSSVDSTNQDSYGGPGWKLILRLDDDTKRVTSRTLKVTNQAYQVISEEDRKRSLIVSGKITTIKCIAFYNQIVKQNQIIINYNDGVILSITNNKNNISNTFYNTGDVVFTCNVKNKNGNIIGNNKYIWEITAPDWQTSKTTINGTPDLTYSNIGEFTQGTITCTVYHSDNNDGVYNTFYGTISSPIHYKPALGIYYINIQGGNRLIQYNEDGTLAAGEEGLIFDPLTFELIAPQGAPVIKDPSADTSPKVLSWLWEVPAQNSLFVTNAQPILNITSTGIDPSATSSASGNYNYYIGDTITGALPFSFNNYTPTAINNIIRLYILYQEGDNQQLITETTTFTPIRMGDPGTNGTNTVAYLQPYNENTSLNNTTRIYAYQYGNTDILQGFYTDNNISLIDPNNFLFRYDIMHNNAPASLTDDKIKWELPIERKVTIANQEQSLFTSFFENVSSTGRTSKVQKSDATLPTVLSNVDGYTSNIIRAKYTNAAGTIFYAEYPICYVHTKNNSYKIKIKQGTGYTYVVYDEAGRFPRYNGTDTFTVQTYYNNNLITQNLEYTWTIFPSQINSNALGFTLKNDTSQTVTCIPSISSNANDLTRAISCVITNTSEEGDPIVGFIYIPISVSLNKYNHKYLNDWDGHSIQLDANGNSTILAPQIGAGVKNNDNSFTGVLMGQVQTKNNNSTTNEVGVFGYDQGVRSFFLNSEDGSAIFGKTGSGQIRINALQDNGEAVIQSGDYNWETGHGMKIKFSSTGTDNGATDGTNEQGPYIKYGSGNFYVTHQGLLHATGATIDGNITINNVNNVLSQLNVSTTPQMQAAIAENNDEINDAIDEINDTITGIQTVDLKNIDEDGEIILKYTGLGTYTANNADMNSNFGSTLNTDSSQGSITTDLNIWSGTRQLKQNNDISKLNFAVDEDGHLYAKNATIAGNIVAGTIGSNNTVTNTGNIRATRVGMGRTTSQIDVSEFPGFAENTTRYLNLWGKNDNNTLSGSNLVFGITENGEVLAKSAHLTGTINATGGKIGDFVITRNSNNKYYLNAETTVGNTIRRVLLTPDASVDQALAIGTKGSYQFYVTPAGVLHATGAEISGNIKAGSAIGDLNVKKDKEASVASFAGIGAIKLTNSNLKESFDYETDTTPWIGILWGGTTANNYNDLQFLVTRKGVLFAKSAHITGAITATSGRIGGINLVRSTDTLYAGIGTKSFTSSNISKSFPGASISTNSVTGILWGSNVSSSDSTYTNNLRFLVSNTGLLWAKGGNIAGWQLNEGYLSSTDTGGYFEINTSSKNSKYGFYLWAGTSSDKKDKKFTVSKTGKLQATGAEITGEITATKLTITDNATISGLKVKNANIESVNIGKVKGTLSGDNITIDFTNGNVSLGSLSANKITSGTLSASRISAGTVNNHAVKWQQIQIVNSVSYGQATSGSESGKYKIKVQNSSGNETWVSGIILTSFGATSGNYYLLVSDKDK